jgi:hypothetical protein
VTNEQIDPETAEVKWIYAQTLDPKATTPTCRSSTSNTTSDAWCGSPRAISSSFWKNISPAPWGMRRRRGAMSRSRDLQFSSAMLRSGQGATFGNRTRASMYTTSKHAVEALAKTVALEPRCPPHSGPVA